MKNLPLLTSRQRGGLALQNNWCVSLIIKYNYRAVQSQMWGLLAELVLLMAVGLLLVAFANNSARLGVSWAPLLFWSGLALIYGPSATRLFTRRVGRQERLGLVVALGLTLYLVKVFHSPIGFTFADEFMHWRAADDMLQTGMLFQWNPLLPVSIYYPGLESLTVVTTHLTGLNLFHSGVFVLGVARVLFVGCLFLFFERVSRSTRIAGIASLLYMANPNFVFFSAQFAYETLSLPLLALTLYIVATRVRRSDPQRWAFGAVLVIILCAIVVTHHITTYVLIMMLVLWSAAHLLRVRNKPDALGPGGVTLLSIMLSVVWFVVVARYTATYLLPQLENASESVVRFLNRQEGIRVLFTGSGYVAPLWERLVGYISISMILLMLPFGLVILWWRYSRNAAALMLGVLALMYPLSLALRLLQSGAEISNRSSEFLFVAVAFVLSLVVTRVRVPRSQFLLAHTMFTIWAVLVFSGGVIIGWAPWARLPGSYLVSADTRSIELQGILAAEWAHDTIGPNNRIATDRINRFLMATYGQQRPITSYGDRIDTARLFFSKSIGKREYEVLRNGQIAYIVVDRRLSSSVPLLTSYFERGEPSTGRHTVPIALSGLTKFDSLENVYRIFDSGDIQIYDVQSFTFP